ncbi:MAG: uroporphyrinogen-III synthase, partial [Myxococcales bacterium]|nr:uroporphyrinogen-III synthase [Myxococcales bacterium]
FLFTYLGRRLTQQGVRRELDHAAETAGLGAPLTIIVGEVVRLRERLGWFERKPLFGLKIVVTRAQGQQGPLASQLAELGAEILPLPSIDFVPAAPDPAVLGQLGGFDLVIFTSANGVDFFLDALWAAGRDPRAFGSARIACIGPATARRLAERGLRADVIPARYVAEGLLEVLLAEGVAGRRVLIPRARVAREILPETLRTAGADVVVLPVYDTVEPPADAATLARIRQGEADLVTLTASSTVTHFRARFSDAEWAHVCAHTRAACIGPVTAATARAAGLDVAVEAGVYTIPGLVEALARR